MTTLTVVTWNQQGRDPDQLRLREALRVWDPDILLLQEAVGPAVDAVLPSSFVARRYWAWEGFGLGLMIASRLPLASAGRLPAQRPWTQPQVCWAKLRVGEQVLTAVDVHLTSPTSLGRKKLRDAQWPQLRDEVHGALTRGEQLVIGGDFNTINPAMEGLTDVAGSSSAATWRTAYAMWLPPLLRLDALFVSPSIGVVSGAPDRRFDRSDHVPVVAQIEL